MHLRLSRSYLGRGVNKKEAERYDRAVDEGRILVVAECRGPRKKQRLAAAERIFAEAGADPLGLVKS